MKQLIFAILIFTSMQSKAQVDTTQLPITVQLKVKHIGYMAASLANSNSIKDVRLRDSLVKYLGSGNNQDSIIYVHLKAGYISSFINGLFGNSAVNTYSTIYELGNGATGLTSITTQLFLKGNNINDPENGVARWLFAQIFTALNNGSATMTSSFNAGKTWLQTPIVYN